MRSIQVERVSFPEDDDEIALGTGIDLAASEPIRFVVPPEAVVGVLAALHAGEKPAIKVHEFDIVDWTAFWDEV